MPDQTDNDTSSNPLSDAHLPVAGESEVRDEGLPTLGLPEDVPSEDDSEVEDPTEEY